jgi:hypothetical protein
LTTNLWGEFNNECNFSRWQWIPRGCNLSGF